jgi:hypothetical protein
MRLSRRNFIKTGLIYVPTTALASTVIIPGPRTKGVVYDSEVLSWINNVGINGGSVSQSTKDAVNTFMVSIKAAGLRSKIARLNLYAGTGLGACKSPLIYDAGDNATDTFQNFVSGDYSESTGLTGDGSTKYVNSRVTSANMYALDSTNHSTSYGAYVRTASDHDSLTMGVYNLSVYDYLAVSRVGHSYFCMSDFTKFIDVTESNGTGFYLGEYNSTTDGKLYRNGSQIGTSTNLGSRGNSAHYIYVHAMNNFNSSALYFTTRTLAGYMMGTGFNATEQSDLRNAWQTFQTALGRQV